MKKSSNISVTALHRFIPQSASRRSSELSLLSFCPCLAAILVWSNFLAIIAFTRFVFQNRKFSKIVKENGLEHITFHGLRHSCLTALANDSQFTMKQVQMYAGHSNFNTTADIYSHVDNTSKLNQLEALTAIL